MSTEPEKIHLLGHVSNLKHGSLQWTRCPASPHLMTACTVLVVVPRRKGVESVLSVPKPMPHNEGKELGMRLHADASSPIRKYVMICEQIKPLASREDSMSMRNNILTGLLEMTQFYLNLSGPHAWAIQW